MDIKPTLYRVGNRFVDYTIDRVGITERAAFGLINYRRTFNGSKLRNSLFERFTIMRLKCLPKRNESIYEFRTFT